LSLFLHYFCCLIIFRSIRHAHAEIEFLLRYVAFCHFSYFLFCRFTPLFPSFCKHVDMRLIITPSSARCLLSVFLHTPSPLPAASLDAPIFEFFFFFFFLHFSIFICRARTAQRCAKDERAERVMQARQPHARHKEAKAAAPRAQCAAIYARSCRKYVLHSARAGSA